MQERLDSLRPLRRCDAGAQGELGEELTWQMGRPIRYTPGEIDRLAERARAMIALAPEALADIGAEPRAGFTRFIRHEPLGVVFVVAPGTIPT